MENKNIGVLTAALALLATAGVVGTKSYKKYKETKSSTEDGSTTKNKETKEDFDVDDLFEDKSEKDNVSPQIPEDAIVDIKSFVEKIQSINKKNENVTSVEDEKITEIKDVVADNVVDIKVKEIVIETISAVDTPVDVVVDNVDESKVEKEEVPLSEDLNDEKFWEIDDQFEDENDTKTK